MSVTHHYWVCTHLSQNAHLHCWFLFCIILTTDPGPGCSWHVAYFCLQFPLQILCTSMQINPPLVCAVSTGYGTILRACLQDIVVPVSRAGTTWTPDCFHYVSCIIFQPQICWLHHISITHSLTLLQHNLLVKERLVMCSVWAVCQPEHLRPNLPEYEMRDGWYAVYFLHLQ